MIQHFQDLGKLDNTLVIYINGDNGTSAEGGPMGTPNEVAWFNGVSDLPAEVQMKFYDVWGTDQTYNHMMFEYSLSAKWLELLKEIAPSVTRVAVLREPSSTAGIGQFAVIQAAAPSLGIEVDAINVRDGTEIERAISAFARTGNGGLIVTANPGAVIHRNLIITLAARHKLPAVYTGRTFVVDGGLISYGPNLVDQTRQAAVYVDQILKGAKPADLPVQAPTKYELAINLKTAKALGLAVPPSLLGRVDEVIE